MGGRKTLLEFSKSTAMHYLANYLNRPYLYKVEAAVVDHVHLTTHKVYVLLTWMKSVFFRRTEVNS